MSIKTLKDAASYAQKFSTRANAAVGDYVAGVQGATGQAAAAAAAAPRWQAAVADPKAAARFAAHVNAAGDAGWKAGVAAKGQARYGQGVTAGMNKWASHVAPFFAALKGLTLPARGLRGAASNAAISTAVQTALHAVKVAQTS